MKDYEQSWQTISRVATSAGVDISWRQWSALGSYARNVPEEIPRRIIDPEALVLLSLPLRADERRLSDMLLWWAKVGVALTSLQRMRTVVEELGGTAPHDFAVFANWAQQAGHRSWKRYATAADDSEGGSSRSPKGPPDLKFVEPSTLMLRLRAAFGVGAKSDVLSFLIGLHGGMATVSVISQAVGYTETAVREALKDMVLARLVHETGNRPAYYAARHKPWIELLELQSPSSGATDVGPRWGMWVPLFKLFINARVIASKTLSGEQDPHVSASAARDLLEECDYALSFHEVPRPNWERYRGLEIVGAFSGVVEEAAEWVTRNG